jgi:multidrug efflux pump subunit AcrA (membrane-fusion protein)
LRINESNQPEKAVNMKCLNFFVIVFVWLIFFGCNAKKNSIETISPPIRVPLKKVQYETISRNVLVSGNIEGSKTVKLGFMVSGKINYIAGEEGDFLKEGQLLASLDSVNYTIAKDIADANLSQTQDEYDRLTKMHERNSISKSDFSKITNSLKIVKSQQQLQAKNQFLDVVTLKKYFFLPFAVLLTEVVLHLL